MKDKKDKDKDVKQTAAGPVADRPGPGRSDGGDGFGQNGIALRVLRALGLWLAIAFTSFGIVSLFIADSAWSLLYLVGFPLLCLMLFMR